MIGPFQWLKKHPGGAARAAGATGMIAGLLYGGAVIAVRVAAVPPDAFTRIPINLVNTFGTWLTAAPAAGFLAGGIGLVLGRPWGRYVALTAACAWGLSTLAAYLALGSFFYAFNVAVNAAVSAAVIVLAGAVHAAAADPPARARGRRFVRGLLALSGVFAGLALIAYAGLYWHITAGTPDILLVADRRALKSFDAASFPVAAVERSFAGVRFLVPREFRYVNSSCEAWRENSLMMIDPVRVSYLEVSNTTQHDSLAEELPLLGGVRGFDYSARYIRERTGLLILLTKSYWPPQEVEEIDLPEWHGFRFRHQTVADDVHLYALWHRATGQPFELAFYVPPGNRDQKLMDAIAASLRIGVPRRTGEDLYREGLALAEAGRHEDARFALALAMQADCTDMRFRLALAREAYAGGHFDDVRSDISRVVEEDPGNDAAKDLLNRATQEIQQRRLRSEAAAPPAAGVPGK